MTTPPDNQDGYNACICDGCPSYPGEGDPKLYCARGKSAKKIKPEGCICPAGCPVYQQYKLDGMYFCIGGKAD